MSFHKDIAIGDGHIVHQWEYADTTARLAATPSSSDIGKVARQLDNDTYWVLKDNSPLTWGRLDGGGGGAGTLQLHLVDTPEKDGNAADGETDGLDTFDFDYTSTQEVHAMLVVPSDYIAGGQIKLQNAVFRCSAASGNVKYKAETKLVRPGTTTALGTAHASTNTEKTLASANRFESVGDIDLTDGSGQINSVPVAPGDILRIVLYRDVANETVPAAADAKLLKNTILPFFGI